MTPARGRRPVEVAQAERRIALEADTTLRVGLVAGERVVVDVQAGEMLAIDGASGELRFVPVEGGLLVVDSLGAEILVRVEGGDAAAASIMLDGRSFPVADVIADALQRIDPAQGEQRQQGEVPVALRDAPPSPVQSTFAPPAIQAQRRGAPAEEVIAPGPVPGDRPSQPPSVEEERGSPAVLAVLETTGAVGDGDPPPGPGILSVDGDDILMGGPGTDTLSGGLGNDTLCGAAGDDTLAGGDGADTADYSYLATGFSASLDAAGIAIVEAAPGDTDILTGVENIVGGLGADTLAGDGGANAISGGEGADTLSGRGGDDTLLGGADGDAADYRYLATGFTASLDSGATVTVTAAAGDTDVLVDIEDILGGAGDDWLFGDLVGNMLDGGAGDDTLSGMDGDDSLAGGAGDDTFLLTGASDGTDTITDASGSDTILGAAGVVDVLNVLSNLANISGVEAFDGGTGSANTILATAGADILDFNALSVSNFTIDGGAGNDTITGTSGGDVIEGGAGNDTLSGRAGNDTLAGGGDSDTADYSYVSAGFTATLVSAGTATITAAAGDIDFLTSIENLVGGGGDDVFFGDTDANVLAGRGGADTLSGGGGADRFVFDASALDAADVIVDFGNDDTLDLGALLESLGGPGAQAADYVSYVQNGSNVDVMIDQDGTGSASSLTRIATIENQSILVVQMQVQADVLP